VENERNAIVCRCSDVTLERIRELIDAGYTSFDEIKRLTRIGMGPCQGKTCQQLVLREIAARTGRRMEDLVPQTTRPPVLGVTLEAIAAEAKWHEE
jgi:bacterioferritin-associated ferredoxin